MTLTAHEPCPKCPGAPPKPPKDVLLGLQEARSTKKKNFAPKKSQADALPTPHKLPPRASPPDSAVSTPVASATGAYSAEQRGLKAASWGQTGASKPVTPNAAVFASER